MNNKIIILTVTLATVGLVVFSLFSSAERNRTAAINPVANSQNSGMDSHHPNAGKNTSAAFLNSLAGKQAPAFSLTDRDGKVYSSENLKGKNVVLFFNEGLMCYPACWNQIAAFGKDERFKSSDTIALSVVVDSKEDWQQAIDQMPELARAIVVFDSGAAISSRFGVLSTPSSMHPGSLPGHTFILIDKEGIVRHIFDDPNMSIHNEQLALEVSKSK